MSEAAPGIETWKEHTSTFDRVRSVAETASQPRSASYIADEALVAENTARNHLQRLVSMHVLLQTDAEGTAVYTPDPLYVRIQTLRELLDEYDHEGLIELKAELQEQLETWREEYDVNSPDALRERAATTDRPAQTREIRKTTSDWELTKYRLTIVEDAIENDETSSRENMADRQTKYTPDPVQQFLDQILELIEENSRDELESQLMDYQSQLESLQAEHDADTASDFRERFTTDDRSAVELREVRNIAATWEALETERRLIEQALNLYNEFGF